MAHILLHNAFGRGQEAPTLQGGDLSVRYRSIRHVCESFTTTFSSQVIYTSSLRSSRPSLLVSATFIGLSSRCRLRCNSLQSTVPRHDRHLQVSVLVHLKALSLVSFPHGSLLPDEVLSLNSTVCRHISSKKQHVAIATKDSNVYVGSGDTLCEQSYSSDVCNTFIAIRNCKRNKIRLVESDNILLSRFVTKKMNPLVNGTGNEEVSTAERYSTLFKSFGSKVKKRLTEQHERYHTNIHTLEDNLQEVVDSIDTLSFKELSVTSDSLPKCNRLASSLNEVYQLNDLVSAIELDSIKPEALKVVESLDSLNAKDYTPFFLKSIPHIALKEDSDKLHCVQVLLYADSLLKFFKSPFKNVQAFTNACPFSQMIVAKLRQEFTMESNLKKRLRPVSMCEKAMSHVIVLGLLVLNFKLDLQIVSESSSRISVKRLVTLSRALGATLIDRGTVVVLKLPLPALPSLASMKGQRGRGRK